jgi:hypothetical protein
MAQLGGVDLGQNHLSPIRPVDWSATGRIASY